MIKIEKVNNNIQVAFTGDVHDCIQELYYFVNNENEIVDNVEKNLKSKMKGKLYEYKKL